MASPDRTATERRNRGALRARAEESRHRLQAEPGEPESIPRIPMRAPTSPPSTRKGHQPFTPPRSTPVGARAGLGGHGLRGRAGRGWSRTREGRRCKDGLPPNSSTVIPHGTCPVHHSQACRLSWPVETRPTRWPLGPLRPIAQSDPHRTRSIGAAWAPAQPAGVLGMQP